MNYQEFLADKAQIGRNSGFDPLWIPDFLFDFQKSLCEWVITKGRGAIFADCGLGKTPMQLVWAQNVVMHTNKPVLILTPLSVGAQTVREGAKFGIECHRSRDGKTDGNKIVVANYEKLHLFNADDFAGVVCDESSILKNFDGETKKLVTHFMRKIRYRLLCTATAAPNDYIELGTSSEALGELGYTDMISRFFIASEKVPHRMEEIKNQQVGGNHFAKLSFRVTQGINRWTIKGHAQDHFWKWICSWARACRKPSDLGYDDGPFVLPELIERDHVIEPNRPADGMLFSVPAYGLNAEREERRRTMQERCELVAKLTDHKEPAVAWCHLNTEGDMLEDMIPDAVQVSGADSDEAKEEAYEGFESGQIRMLVMKPKIGAFGLNWQHCNHTVTFASHSYEQYYQLSRRFWRFGQKRPVTVDIISTTGEVYVRDNMKRKAAQASEMFSRLVANMNDSLSIAETKHTNQTLELPNWIS